MAQSRPKWMFEALLKREVVSQNALRGYDPESSTSVFRPSLGVKLITPSGRCESPVELRPEVKAQIDAGLKARESIIRSYAQLDGELSNLLERSGLDADYYSFRNCSERLTAAKDLGSRLESSRREFVLDLLRTAERLASRLEIVLGFLEMREAKSGLVTFTFEVWNRRAKFTPAELQTEAAGFNRIVTEVTRYLRPLREVERARKAG